MPSPENESFPNVLHLPDDIERRKADDPFAFLDPENIQELRNAQERFVYEEEKKWHPDSIEAREKARDAALNNLDWLNREYLRRMGVKPGEGDGEDDYDDYLHTMHQVSINQMSQVEWSLGATDANGNRIPGGREAVGDLHDKKLKRYKQSISHRLGTSLASPDITQPVHITPNPSSPDVTQQVTPNIMPTPDDSDDIETKTNVPGALIDKIQADIDKKRQDAERLQTIYTVSEQLDAARERLAILAQGKTTTKEYRLAEDEWTQLMVYYGELCEGYLQSLDPVRTDEQRNADATGYVMNQISQLDALKAKKWAQTLRGRVIKSIKESGVAQRILAGVGAGMASFATGQNPAAVAAAAVAGATTGFNAMAQGLAAIPGSVNEVPFTAYDASHLTDLVERNKSSISDAANYVRLLFTEGLRERRRRAGRNAVFGGLAVALTTAAIGAAYEAGHGPDFPHFDSTVEGRPLPQAPQGAESTYPPGQGHIDMNTGEPGGDAPDTPGNEQPKPPVQPEQPQPPTNHPEIPSMITPEALIQGVNVPLEWGDGALAVGERLGLDPDQQQRFLELLSQRHDGSTYQGPDGVRLYFNGGALHLSPTDLSKILNP